MSRSIAQSIIKSLQPQAVGDLQGIPEGLKYKIPDAIYSPEVVIYIDFLRPTVFEEDSTLIFARNRDEELVEHDLTQRVGGAQTSRDNAHGPIAVAGQCRLYDGKPDIDRTDTQVWRDTHLRLLTNLVAAAEPRLRHGSYSFTAPSGVRPRAV